MNIKQEFQQEVRKIGGLNKANRIIGTQGRIETVYRNFESLSKTLSNREKRQLQYEIKRNKSKY